MSKIEAIRRIRQLADTLDYLYHDRPDAKHAVKDILNLCDQAISDFEKEGGIDEA